MQAEQQNVGLGIEFEQARTNHRPVLQVKGRQMLLEHQRMQGRVRILSQAQVVPLQRDAVVGGADALHQAAGRRGGR